MHDLQLADLHPTVLVLDHEGFPMGDSGQALQPVAVERFHEIDSYGVVIDRTLHRSMCIRLEDDQASPWPLKPLPRWALAPFRASKD